MKLFKKIFDHEYKELEKFKAQANLIVAKDEEMSKLSDDELKIIEACRKNHETFKYVKKICEIK